MTQNPTNQRHIFLVDDDQEDREMFAEALSNLDDDNVLFTEFSDATKLIEHLNNPLTPIPELIFMDVNMPKVSGIDCLKKLKDKNGKFKELNVVIYSTYSHATDIEEAFKIGASRYYVKPTVFNNLKDLISGALKINMSKIARENFFVNYAL